MKKPFIFFKPKNSVEKELDELKKKPAAYWEGKGQRKIFDLFKFTYENVPAYKKFLKEQGVKGSDVKSAKDFNLLPGVSKKDYLRKYTYESLFPKNTFYSATTFSATSGSTGEPFYFPRGEQQDLEYQYMAEIFLKDQFDIGKKKTLGIMGFALGIWIGGIFTYKTLNRIAENGYNFTLIPTGTNKDQFLGSLKKFGHLYDQVILMGYPPFIKDVIDSAPEYGINWGDYSIKILTAAEGYSEKFREYIAEKAKIKNFFKDIVNMYGTVELGTMAHETQFANLIRNLAYKDEKLFKCLFPNATNIPTLAQYYPHLHYFEEKDGELLVSGYGSLIPLIRYKTSDLGGVIPFETMLAKLKSCGVDIKKEMKIHKISSKVLKLPFVYLYTRSDFAVVFRGANIYPEEIRNALDSDVLNEFVTGKTTIIRKEDENLNQILEINVELRKDVSSNNILEKKISDSIINELVDTNSEYNYLYTADAEKMKPKIVVWPYGHDKYFGLKGKQAWMKN